MIDSAEPFVHDCDRCGLLKAKGTRIVRTGRVFFKCDDCGKNNDMGYLEDAHKNQVTSKQGYENAVEKRDRFWRENQEKQEIEFKQRKEGLDTNAHEVFSIDYATKKWKF